MGNDRRAIFWLLANGRITPSEAERLLIACNAGRDGFWIVAACVAAALITLVPHQGFAALLNAQSFVHHLLGGIQ